MKRLFLACGVLVTAAFSWGLFESADGPAFPPALDLPVRAPVPLRFEVTGSTEARVAVVEELPADHPAPLLATLTFVDASTVLPCSSTEWELSTPEHRIRVVTNERGEAWLPAGTWTVRPDEPREAFCCPGRIQIASGEARVVWVHRRVGARVLVLDTWGQPIRDADVCWEPTALLQEPGSGWPLRSRTDRSGMAELASVPAGFAGRLGVSKLGFLPALVSVPQLRAGHPVRVVLHPGAADPSWGLHCSDPEGIAMDDVVVLAAEEPALRLGRTDENGTVGLDPWVADSRELLFEGSAFPSRVLLSERMRSEAGRHSVVLPRPATGALVPDRILPGTPVRISFSSVARYGASPLPATVDRVVGSDGRIPFTLPASWPADVVLWSADGRGWSGVLEVDSTDWEQAVPCVELPELTFSSAVTIQRVRGFSDEVVDPFDLPMLGRAGASVTCAVPARMRRVEVVATDGRSVWLGPGDLDVLGGVEVRFEDHVPLLLEVVDSKGDPILDVTVSLRVTGEERRHASRSRFQARPDARGITRFGVPAGTYRVQLRPLPGRRGGKTLPISSPPGSLVVVPAPDEPIRVIASRPRLLEVSLISAAEGAPTDEWSIVDPERHEEFRFGGSRAELWISSDAYELEVRSETRDLVRRLPVPAGDAAWSAEISF